MTCFFEFSSSLSQKDTDAWPLTFHIIYNKPTLQIDLERNLKDTFYQIRCFKCKMFVDNSIIARWESTRASWVQLETPLVSSGITEEQRVPVLVCSHLERSKTYPM